MKKFAFRLESVRRLREQEEQAVQTELAAALRERANLEHELTRSQQAETAIYEYVHGGNLTGAELAHVAQYGTLHRRRILDARTMLQLTDERIVRVRARLVDARAKREALDKLCERQREQHRREWLASEMQELDEIGSRRARANVRLLNPDLVPTTREGRLAG